MERDDSQREMQQAFQKMDDPKTAAGDLDLLKARADQVRVNINKQNERLEQLDMQAADLKGMVTTEFTAIGTEQVTVPAGTFDAMKVQGFGDGLETPIKLSF